MPSKKTKIIRVGSVLIGGGLPIVVQSMTKVHPKDVRLTLLQIREAYEAGCEIMRIALPDEEAVEAIPDIRSQSPVPLIGDVHFVPKLALKALEKGIDGLRINPGTMPSRKAMKEIFEAAKEKKTAIRIGVNAGSLPKKYLNYDKLSSALVASALEALEIAEAVGFQEIKVSLKATDVMETIEAYRKFSQISDYPLHLGITEAGPPLSGAIKSAVGIGILLNEGIGDTIRVSLTASPVLEVRAAYHILGALGLRRRGVEIISCPTCGRCEVDLSKIVAELESKLSPISEPLKIAVMGCIVNGPREAKNADLGIAAGKKYGVLFKKGKVIEKIPSAKWAERIMEEVNRFLSSKEPSWCKGSSEKP